MSESSEPATAQPSPTGSEALRQRLEALRRAGAPRLDPVRFRYVETVFRRVADAQPGVRQHLLATLDRALTACEGRVRDAEPAPPEPEAGVATVSAGAHRTMSQPPAPEPLVALNRYIVAAAAESEDYDLLPPVWESSDGLRNARRFRASWQRHRTEDALGLAVERAPEAAGPLNSHRLVLRAMTLMQELSPLYLQSFVVQAETLLRLDRAAARLRQSAPPPKTRPRRSTPRSKA